MRYELFKHLDVCKVNSLTLEDFDPMSYRQMHSVTNKIKAFYKGLLLEAIQLLVSESKDADDNGDARAADDLDHDDSKEDGDPRIQQVVWLRLCQQKWGVKLKAAYDVWKLLYRASDSANKAAQLSIHKNSYLRRSDFTVIAKVVARKAESTASRRSIRIAQFKFEKRQRDKYLGITPSLEKEKKCKRDKEQQALRDAAAKQLGMEAEYNHIDENGDENFFSSHREDMEDKAGFHADLPDQLKPPQDYRQKMKEESDAWVKL